MNANLKRIQACLLFVTLAFVVLCGCHRRIDHPWQGEAYQPPSKYKPVPKSTYAPIPSILPSVDGTKNAPDDESIPGDAGTDDELERVLRELNIN